MMQVKYNPPNWDQMTIMSTQVECESKQQNPLALKSFNDRNKCLNKNA